MRRFSRVAGLCGLAIVPLPALGQTWCEQPPRPEYDELVRVATADPWFHVYEAEAGVFAIYEPYNFQEVISWLIMGSDLAVLFDTGMGMSSISEVVQGLTKLPVAVINSHTHYDHIGGNAEFDDVRSMDTDYTRASARGIPHAEVAQEVAPGAFCDQKLEVAFDTSSYRILPFETSAYIEDGSTIDLGGRQVEVIGVPGHTLDAVALLDRERGFLWTGDTFYAGPIWLYFPGTDLDAYGVSITRLAALAPSLRRVFPGHNTPVADPAVLLRVRDAFFQVRGGDVPFTDVGDGLARYEFDGFSFLMLRPGPPFE